jgi:hypothetical protein
MYPLPKSTSGKQQYVVWEQAWTSLVVLYGLPAAIAIPVLASGWKCHTSTQQTTFGGRGLVHTFGIDRTVLCTVRRLPRGVTTRISPQEIGVRESIVLAKTIGGTCVVDIAAAGEAIRRRSIARHIIGLR